MSSQIRSDPKPTTKRCCLCRRTENNELMYGTFHSHKGIVVHYFCLLLSSRVEQNGRDEEGILGFMPVDIRKEVQRGQRLVCTYCSRNGATVACSFKRCKTQFHLPCGLTNGSLHQFFGQYKSFCYKHRPHQKIPTAFSKRLKDGEVRCLVCFEDLPQTVNRDVMWAPCCKNAWFHRPCVQNLAFNCGYFFKCPQCNDKSQFEKAMMQYGIFIPEQDASWERVPNAYHELLHRYSHCDAEKCICPKGRNHNDEGTRWEVILCQYCGAQGIHKACGRRRWTNPTWECRDCTAVVKRPAGAAEAVAQPVNRALPGASESDTAPASPSPPAESSSLPLLPPPPTQSLSPAWSPSPAQSAPLSPCSPSLPEFVEAIPDEDDDEIVFLGDIVKIKAPPKEDIVYDMENIHDVQSVYDVESDAEVDVEEEDDEVIVIDDSDFEDESEQFADGRDCEEVSERYIIRRSNTLRPAVLRSSVIQASPVMRIQQPVTAAISDDESSELQQPVIDSVVSLSQLPLDHSTSPPRMSQYLMDPNNALSSRSLQHGTATSHNASSQKPQASIPPNSAFSSGLPQYGTTVRKSQPVVSPNEAISSRLPQYGTSLQRSQPVVSPNKAVSSNMPQNEPSPEKPQHVAFPNQPVSSRLPQYGNSLQKSQPVASPNKAVSSRLSQYRTSPERSQHVAFANQPVSSRLSQYGTSSQNFESVASLNNPMLSRLLKPVPVINHTASSQPQPGIEMDHNKSSQPPHYGSVRLPPSVAPTNNASSKSSQPVKAKGATTLQTPQAPANNSSSKMYQPGMVKDSTMSSRIPQAFTNNSSYMFPQHVPVQGSTTSLRVPQSPVDSSSSRVSQSMRVPDSTTLSWAPQAPTNSTSSRFSQSVMVKNPATLLQTPQAPANNTLSWSPKPVMAKDSDTWMQTSQSIAATSNILQSRLMQSKVAMSYPQPSRLPVPMASTNHTVSLPPHRSTSPPPLLIRKSTGTKVPPKNSASSRLPESSVAKDHPSLQNTLTNHITSLGTQQAVMVSSSMSSDWPQSSTVTNQSSSSQIWQSVVNTNHMAVMNSPPPLSVRNNAGIQVSSTDSTQNTATQTSGFLIGKDGAAIEVVQVCNLASSDHPFNVEGDVNVGLQESSSNAVMKLFQRPSIHMRGMPLATAFVTTNNSPAKKRRLQ